MQFAVAVSAYDIAFCNLFENVLDAVCFVDHFANVSAFLLWVSMVKFQAGGVSLRAAVALECFLQFPKPTSALSSSSSLLLATDFFAFLVIQFLKELLLFAMLVCHLPSIPSSSP